MTIRTTTLFSTVLALTMTSSAFAGDGDLVRMILRHALSQGGNSGFNQHDNHQQGQHTGHGSQFQQVQQFNPGGNPSVMPYVNPGISQPRLNINGRFVCGEGVRITRVLCGGLADHLRLVRGDTIVAINGETIRSMSHFRDLLRDAVVCNGGHADLLVRKVCGYPNFVTVHADFPVGTPQVMYHNHQ